MDIPCISIGVDIHGISMDIPCISTKYMNELRHCARGNGCPQRLNPTASNLPPLSLAAAAAVVSQDYFFSPSLVAGNNLNLARGERWGQASKGAFTAGDQCVEQLRCLPGLKIEKK